MFSLVYLSALHPASKDAQRVSKLENINMNLMKPEKVLDSL
jgi:hypothetical protein